MSQPLRTTTNQADLDAAEARYQAELRILGQAIEILRRPAWGYQRKIFRIVMNATEASMAARTGGQGTGHLVAIDGGKTGNGMRG